MRSAAKHRSDSAARSTPTRAQRRDTPKISKNLICKKSCFCYINSIS
ncbi:MAG: hypothetical protein NZ455_00370 [Bacteroidia bacterium]|nr:hypothetical protein [Bacteroidia bacterium]